MVSGSVLQQKRGMGDIHDDTISSFSDDLLDRIVFRNVEWDAFCGYFVVRHDDLWYGWDMGCERSGIKMILWSQCQCGTKVYDQEAKSYCSLLNCLCPLFTLGYKNRDGGSVGDGDGEKQRINQ